MVRKLLPECKSFSDQHSTNHNSTANEVQLLLQDVTEHSVTLSLVMSTPCKTAIAERDPERTKYDATTGAAEFNAVTAALGTGNLQMATGAHNIDLEAVQLS